MKIVFALDGGPAAAAALEGLTTWMGRFPEREHLQVVLLGVHIPTTNLAISSQEFLFPLPQGEELELALDHHLMRHREELLRYGIAARAVRRVGEPALTIAEFCEEEKADLLVVGSRNMSLLERWLLGSVSSSLLQEAPCSVLVVKHPEQMRPQGPLFRLPLFCVDGSVASHEAIRAVSRLGWLDHADSVVLGTVAEGPLDALVMLEHLKTAERLVPQGLEGKLRTSGRTGDVPSGLVLMASEEHCDLMVLGAHTRPPLARLMPGGVATHVAKHSGISVLLVKPGTQLAAPREATVSPPRQEQVSS